MRQFIAPKSDQINADDLIGGPRTITVTRVNANEGNGEQPINIYFDGDNGKPFRPCKSMRRLLATVWGVQASAYVGQSMTIYRDPKVQWGGLEVGGIRISHMTGLDAPKVVVLTESKTKRKPVTIQPLKVEALAPKQDRAAKLAETLIDRIRTEDLDAVKADPKVIEQRAWLAKNRPELSAQVDAAITEATLMGAE
jgi:hypothetical protein